MNPMLRGVFCALALSLAVAPSARGACTSDTCTDQTVVDSMRSLIADACDCAGSAKHGKYVKCAKQLVKSSVKDATLPKQCRGPVMKCEAQSTCGRQGSAVCCVKNAKGKVKAKMIKAGGKCPGTACAGSMALAEACTGEATCAEIHRGVRSFKSVQQVFKTSCALSSCHSTFARKGELVLEAEALSYRSLVGKDAALAEAKPMLRVKPGDPDNSFLMKKLRGEGPGDPMPQAGDALPQPVIDMVRDWIARGALTTEEECSQKPGACNDDGPVGDYHWAPLPPLEAPLPGEGIQLHVPPRDVPSGTEWEMCYAFHPNWTEIATQLGLPSGLPVIKEQVYRMHPGSHHLLLYAYLGTHPEQWAEGYFPCVAANCVSASDCPQDADGIDDPNDPTDDDTAFVLPIGGTQVAGTRYDVKYPEGVGVPVLGKDSVLIVNPHFTNPFQPAQQTYGEAWLNLNFYKPGEFKVTLDGIFGINFGGLFVEPYETRTMSRIWRPCSILDFGCNNGPVDAAIFQLFGHMHKRGTEFQIDYVRGGACSGNGRVCGRDADCPKTQTCVRVPGAEDTTIYYTTAWDQAPIIDFPDPYFRVQHDEGLRWTCTHTNGIQGDPAHPPKRCQEGCGACGWDDATRTCIFTRGVSFGIDQQPRIYQEGDPMPLVFGQLADDDMCNMFGYFINQKALSLLP
jgi:hypothetical protein